MSDEAGACADPAKRKNICLYSGVFGGGACCLIAFALAFFIIIVIPTSYHAVPYDKWGIDYSKLTKHVSLISENDAKCQSECPICTGGCPYEGGLYWTGMSHKFLLLPRTYLTLDFHAANPDSLQQSLVSRTQDGLAITLDVSFQYKIEREHVMQVYDEFSDAYERIVIQIARDKIRDVCSEYDAIEFFGNRTFIGQHMLDAVASELGQIDIVVNFLQLRRVDLPDEYENILEEKEVQRQKTAKAENDQKSSVVVAETESKVAERLSDVTLVEARRDAEAIAYTAEANANKTLAKVGAFAAAYDGMATTLGLTADELIAYVWVDSIVSQHQSDKIFMSIRKPSTLDF